MYHSTNLLFIKYFLIYFLHGDNIKKEIGPKIHRHYGEVQSLSSFKRFLLVGDKQRLDYEHNLLPCTQLKINTKLFLTDMQHKFGNNILFVHTLVMTRSMQETTDTLNIKHLYHCLQNKLNFIFDIYRHVQYCVRSKSGFESMRIEF